MCSKPTAEDREAEIEIHSLMKALPHAQVSVYVCVNVCMCIYE